MFRILTFLLIGGGAYYGINWARRQTKLIKETCVHVASFKINDISTNLVDLTLQLEVINKTDLSFDITGQSYDIYINREHVAPIRSDKNFHLDKGGSAMMPVNIQFNPLQVLKIAVLNIFNIKEVLFGIKGKLTVMSGILIINQLPVDFEDTIGSLMEGTGDSSKC